MAWRLAAEHCGLMRRADLLRAGVTPAELRAEVHAGRWVKVGPNTLALPETPVPHWRDQGGKYAGHHLPSGITGVALTDRDVAMLRRMPLMRPPRVLDRGAIDTDFAPFWWAVWESSTGAVLDGASALVAAGLRNFTLDVIDVSLPRGARRRRFPGIRTTRRRDLGEVVGAVPRVIPPVATVRAAQLAATDRQAALLISMAAQQRIVAPGPLMAHWASVARSPRHTVIGHVIADVCDGAHSLGELDFARLCRDRGLPEPTRQAVRRGPGGRIYLDVAFACGLVVEIDGVHHSEGLAPVDDALRANAVTLQRGRVLRIPVLGLRLSPDAFLDQVAAGIRQLTAQ